MLPTKGLRNEELRTDDEVIKKVMSGTKEATSGRRLIGEEMRRFVTRDGEESLGL